MSFTTSLDKMKAIFTVSVLFLLFGLVRGGKYNLTGTMRSSLVASHDSPDANCQVPGVCVPVNQTIPGQTLWYWCGFYTTHKTIYTVRSNHATNNFSGSWMIRKSKLLECVLTNLTGVENCPTVPETSCTSKKSCTVRSFGLVFSDEMCLMVINNKAGAIVGTIQVNNWFSRPRLFGSVFTVIIAVVGLSLVLATVGYQMYSRCKAPVGKPRPHIRREDEMTPVTSFTDDLKSSAAVPVHRPTWYSKLLFGLSPKWGRSDKSEP
ncbi:hypothetical protein Vretimale_5922 [Volvox reticuliferus]|uniref:Uncharacterized protein n=1 Tax=Volvox reticuliferus TaxID=1737510 RepID=A0A8J4LLM9_9CHLO|nr:hypothetical protein Vretifemale_5973 [Volvox reticuliferus]GIM01070.1 hypothetical protein Vretimale_5922 [Volvox reticuliferus]